MITPEQALAIYHAGPEALVKVICDLSARVEAQQRQIDLLLRKVVEKASSALEATYAELLDRLPLEQALNIKFLTGLPDADTRAYGQRLLAAVKAMFKVIHRRDQTAPPAFQRALEAARDRILEVALADVPSRLDANGKELKREAANMAKRFRENGKAYFEFITTPGIGPTNNLAEQAVRFVVIDRRITQGTRSLKGRETCERLWTVVGTCAMQGRSAFEFILAAVRAHFRGEPAPSLLPALG